MVRVGSTYRAVQAVSPGKLELTEKPLLDPNPGHVRIRVEAYLRKVGSDALLAGDVSAGASILKGISGLNFGGGSLGNSSIGNPTQIGALY